MKIELSKLETQFIKTWFSYESDGHFGDGAFAIGEESSILQKIKIDNNINSVVCDFNLTELEILKNWSSHNHGVYEELKLKHRIEIAYEIEKRNFVREIKKNNG